MMKEGMDDEIWYIEDILKGLSRNFYGRLIFAGIIDDKAKLMHFQKGESRFVLSISRQNALDVQVSLILSLAKQFEDFAGPLDNVILSGKKYDLAVTEILPQLHLYVICAKGSAADILDMVARVVEVGPHKSQELIEDEWYS
jgi:hypothetical protein